MRSLFKTTLVLAAAAALAVTFAVAPATSKTPNKKAACWKVLINDWYDGRIDGKYGLPCYREALKHLKGSTDVRGYTSAYEDIYRAYQRRRADLLGRTGSDGEGPSSSSGQGGPTSGGGSNPRNDGAGCCRSEGFSPVAPADVAPAPGRDDPTGPADDLIQKLGPADATSVPIPLIVLAGVALLLLAAGALSLFARRAHARRVTAPVQPAPPSRSR
jgi:hypothetical protein